MSGPAGLAALSICESMLLSMTDTGLIDDNEAKAILEDAATAHHHEAAGAVDGEAGDHREAAAIIEAIIIGGNSVRHRRRDSGEAAPVPDGMSDGQ